MERRLRRRAIDLARVTSDRRTAARLTFGRRGMITRSIPDGSSALLRRNASRTSRLSRLRHGPPGPSFATPRSPGVDDRDRSPPRTPPAPGRTPSGAVRSAAEILGILQTLVRAKGRLDVHDGRSTSRPGISGSRTMRGEFKRSRIKRPRRLMCQINSAPSAARATRPVPSKPATARPSLGRASGRSSRIRRSRLRGGLPGAAGCSVDPGSSASVMRIGYGGGPIIVIASSRAARLRRMIRRVMASTPMGTSPEPGTRIIRVALGEFLDQCRLAGSTVLGTTTLRTTNRSPWGLPAAAGIP